MNIAYLRVSTDEQASSGLGLEAQLAAIEKHLGQKPDMVFRDEGISGKRADRPGLLAALGAAARIKGAVILCAKRDRLSRDLYLSCWLQKEVEKRCASIVSVDGAGNGDEPHDILMRNMVDAFAQYERQLIGKRTKSALAAKKKRGEYAGGRVPYGYCLRGKKLYKLPSEQQVIRLMVDLKDKGYTLHAICKELSLAGHRTRAGKINWQVSTVKGILGRV